MSRYSYTILQLRLDQSKGMHAGVLKILVHASDVRTSNRSEKYGSELFQVQIA